jgi:Tol biopolymer transport system component
LLPADSLTGSASPFFRFRPPRTAIALSPDGRLVVFSGKQGTLAQLYRRALDQTEARPIPGTEKASEPFFSPDGTWIGFTANNKIKKVPLSGGPPVTICDESLNRSAGKSWGQDGTILFAGIGGISKASCAGGTPITVTRSDASKGECHLFPHWLPGGRAILFTTVIADEWDTANTLVYSLDSGESRVIIPGGVDARYVDTGHVVYMKTSTLMAVSFDSRSQQVTSAPVALLEGVMQGMNAICGDDETGAGQFTVSRTGTLLYVAGGIGPILQRSLVWVDRSGVQQPLGAPESLYTAPRLAPDGQKIAFFASRGATRTNDIWVYDVLRGAPIRLTFDGNNTFPIWSPDGKRLVYGSSTAGISNLYAINADGSGTPERLTTSNQVELPSSWASADNVIAFLRRDQSDGEHGIWVLPMDGDRTPRLFLESRFILEYPEFSPDGHWMAYVSDESGITEVFVQPYPGPGEKIRISTSGGVQPIWTADGRELLYRARTPDTQQMFSVAIHSLSPFRADAPRLLFEAGISDYGSAAPIRGWDISADRQRFLFMGSIRSMPKPVTAIHVVQNWAEELKRLVPTSRSRV